MAKIVVIDDHIEMLENIQEILELDGYSITTATNGKEGIKQIRDVLPDLIICDIMMPELDGYGVLKIISSKPETQHIPFVFLTAKNELTDFRKGMNLGADDYLAKPFTDLELLEAVSTRINRTNSLKQGTQQLNQLTAKINERLETESDIQWETKQYAKGQTLFKTNTYPDQVYRLNSGVVKLTKKNNQGKELITTIANEGELIGDIALINETSHTHIATCLTAVEASVLPRNQFHSLLYSDKQLSKEVIKLLANNVKEKEEKLLSMAYSSVRKRIIEAILSLDSKLNTKKENNFFIKIKRKDLAALAGTVKETTIRTLSDLRDEQLIELKHSGLTIANREHLQSLANQKVT